VSMSNDRPEANVIFHLQRNQKIVFFFKNVMKYAMPAICGSLLTTKADQWKKLINPNSQSETKQRDFIIVSNMYFYRLILSFKNHYARKI